MFVISYIEVITLRNLNLRILAIQSLIATLSGTRQHKELLEQSIMGIKSSTCFSKDCIVEPGLDEIQEFPTESKTSQIRNIFNRFGKKLNINTLMTKRKRDDISVSRDTTITARMSNKSERDLESPIWEVPVQSDVVPTNIEKETDKCVLDPTFGTDDSIEKNTLEEIPLEDDGLEYEVADVVDASGVRRMEFSTSRIRTCTITQPLQYLVGWEVRHYYY